MAVIAVVGPMRVGAHEDELPPGSVRNCLNDTILRYNIDVTS